HEGYDTPHEVVYVRSLSINEKYQGNGYGTTVAQNLPVYVQENFSAFDHLYLVVDGENAGAWNLYERAGFLHLATKEEGPIGKERLYYLDLNRNYVPNLRLELDDSVDRPAVRIILKMDDKEAGYIDAEIEGTTLDISHWPGRPSTRTISISHWPARPLTRTINSSDCPSQASCLPTRDA